ncbi:hypothetical protein FACS1894201_03130 [Bacteroidia bacterium]|nr:hypothetical protein FACS1894201_03130 [Bacteroidia bacterium]
MGIINRIVDIERRIVPISATIIRDNVENYKEYLSSIIYEEFINGEIIAS